MKYLFKGERDGAHDFWISYTDLMCGFLIVFIIASIIANKQYSQQKKKFEDLCAELKLNPDSIKSQIEELNNRASLKNQILEYKDIFDSTDDIKVDFNTQRGSIILLPQDPQKFLFDRGESIFEPALENYLEKRYDRIVEKTMELSSVYNNIELRIEGHTDPTWEGELRGSNTSFINNLNLSSDRANAVYEYILNGKKLKESQREFVKKSMISVGYSFSQRIQKNNIDSISLDPSSRRIEFRIISK